MNRKIAMRDDCDPDDPGWDPTGGCALRRGDVDLAEFVVELEHAGTAFVRFVVADRRRV